MDHAPAKVHGGSFWCPDRREGDPKDNDPGFIHCQAADRKKEPQKRSSLHLLTIQHVAVFALFHQLDGDGRRAVFFGAA
jgi:hypothetical protein